MNRTYIFVNNIYYSSIDIAIKILTLKPLKKQSNQLTDALMWSTIKFATVISILFNILQYCN
jgi:hypothetical protein